MGRSNLLTLAAALAAVAFMSGVALAATNNVFLNDYYSNVGTPPDGSVRVANQSGASLCALVHVTDFDQELRECCGCPISNGGTLTFDIDTDLTNNPANGNPTANGSIAIISSASATICNAAKPKATPELEAWATNPQGGDLLTEESFTALPLSSGALANLSAECAAVQLVGSGAGICTCPATKS